jgi:hypothetical protein
MQFARAVCGIASACLLSTLVACGGGGGGGDDKVDFPANDTIVVNSATSATPASTYSVDRTAGDAGTEVATGGRIVEWAYTENSYFMIQVAFLQSEPGKFLLLFDDDSGDYVCRSNNLSNTELQILVGAPVIDVPVCSGEVRIDASAHRLRASKVTITDPSAPSNKVVVSANVSWSL